MGYGPFSVDVEFDPQTFIKGLYIQVFYKMTVSSRDVVCFILYFIFLTTISIIDTSFQYPVLIGGAIMIILMSALRGTWPKSKFIDLFALIPLLIWMYGFSVGIINSNNLVGVVRNFAGLLFYLVYFFMVFSGISRSKLLSVLINASIIYLMIAFAYGITSFMGRGLLSVSDYGTSALRFYYSVGQFILIPTLFIFLSGSSPSLRLDFDRLAIVKKNNFIVVAIILSLIFSGGKGFYLELVALAVVFMFLFVVRFITHFRVGYRSLFLLVTLSWLGIYFIAEIISAISFLITLESDGSHPRTIQAKALIEDFTMFGKGLGAVVPNYSRDILGYGFELSYHNIVHKFGIISLFIFASFLVPVFYSLYSIFLRASKIYSYLPLIFMLYLVPSWGNPTVFAPLSVILHCLALYFIRLDTFEETINV